MIDIKGLNFPKDISLIFLTIIKLIKFYFISKRRSTKDLIDYLKKAKQSKQIDNEKFILRLTKIHKLSSYIMSNIIRYKKPCLIRSAILYEQCRLYGVKVELVIAVKKHEKDLEGHSWIKIFSKPFLENEKELEKYSIMLKG